ncbi:hypothetical protein A3Q56_05394, partial [Intoshia linei]
TKNKLLHIKEAVELIESNSDEYNRILNEINLSVKNNNFNKQSIIVNMQLNQVNNLSTSLKAYEYDVKSISKKYDACRNSSLENLNVIGSMEEEFLKVKRKYDEFLKNHYTNELFLLELDNIVKNVESEYDGLNQNQSDILKQLEEIFTSFDIIKDKNMVSNTLIDSNEQLFTRNEIAKKFLIDLLNAYSTLKETLASSNEIMDNYYYKTNKTLNYINESEVSIKNTVKASQAYDTIIDNIRKAYNMTMENINKLENKLDLDNTLKKCEKLLILSSDLLFNIKQAQISVNEDTNIYVSEIDRDFESLNTKLAFQQAKLTDILIIKSNIDTENELPDVSKYDYEGIYRTISENEEKIEFLNKNISSAKKNLVEINQKELNFTRLSKKINSNIQSMNESIHNFTSTNDYFFNTLNDMGNNFDELNYNLKDMEDYIKYGHNKVSSSSTAMKFNITTFVDVILPYKNEMMAYLNSIQFMVKTNVGEAILFYFGDKKSNYICGYIVNGKLLVELQKQTEHLTGLKETESKTILIDVLINDQNWHEINVVRKGTELNVQVDTVKNFAITSKSALINFENVVLLFGNSENIPTLDGDTFSFFGDDVVAFKLRRIEKSSRSNSFNIRFKTLNDAGVLLYSGSEESKYLNLNYINLYIKDGRIHYDYDLGTGAAHLTSKKNYNDGKWHSVVIQRLYKNGILKIDGETIDMSISSGISTQLTLGDLVHTGRLPNRILVKNSNDFPPFTGCISSIVFGNMPMKKKNVHYKSQTKTKCSLDLNSVYLSEIMNKKILLEMKNLKMKDAILEYIFSSTGNKGTILHMTNDDFELIIHLKNLNVNILLTSFGVNHTFESKSLLQNSNSIYIQIENKLIKIMLNNELFVSFDEHRFDPNLIFQVHFGSFPNIDNTKYKRFTGCIGPIVHNDGLIDFTTFASIEKNKDEIYSCENGRRREKNIGNVNFSKPHGSIIFIFINYYLDVVISKIHLNKCYLKPIVESMNNELFYIGLLFSETTAYYYNNMHFDLKLKFEFSFKIKTQSKNGVIIYANDVKHVDFFGVVIDHGRFIFTFNCGSGVLMLTSNKLYNDGKWHSVKIGRNESKGYLSIDSKLIATGNTPGSARSIDITSVIQFGSIDKQSERLSRKNLDGLTKSFKGCIKEITLNENNLQKENFTTLITPCKDDLELGVYIYENQFFILNDFNINFSIRARSNNGIILSLFSESMDDLVIIRLADGNVEFVTFYEGQETITQLSLESNFEICDDKWHYIEVYKTNNVYTISVNGIYGYPSISNMNVFEMKANLYLGNVPNFIEQPSVEKYKTNPFSGCIRDVNIDGNQFTYSEMKVHGKIQLGRCPKY